MLEFHFCYWLMGVFELGQLKRLNPKQLILIKEHLNLVEIRQYSFCNWLEGFLDANGLEYMPEQKVDKMLEKLRLEFYSVIDQSYSKEILQQLYDAHLGKT